MFTDAGEQARKPFTLIEMLVVVAIIAILVSLLAPSLRSSLRMAKMAQCASNQRQCYTALAAYAADANGLIKTFQQRADGNIKHWGGFLSGKVTWDSDNANGTPYLPAGPVYDCPDRPRWGSEVWWMGKCDEPGGNDNRSFGMLQNVGWDRRDNQDFRFFRYFYGGRSWLNAPGEEFGWGTYQQYIRIKRVRTPSQIPCISDSLRSGPPYDHRGGDNMFSIGGFKPDGQSDWGGCMWFHHPAYRANICFFDGSVRSNVTMVDLNEGPLNWRYFYDAVGDLVKFNK